MFLLNTLTVPKIKDLVNKPNQQYKDIFDTLNASGAGASASGAERAGASGAGADRAKAVITSVKNNNIDPVADELSSFLNDLKKNTTQKKSSNDFESYTNDNIVASSIVGGEISGGSGSSNYSLF